MVTSHTIYDIPLPSIVHVSTGLCTLSLRCTSFNTRQLVTDIPNEGWSTGNNELEHKMARSFLRTCVCVCVRLSGRMCLDVRRRSTMSTTCRNIYYQRCVPSIRVGWVVKILFKGHTCSNSVHTRTSLVH